MAKREAEKKDVVKVRTFRMKESIHQALVKHAVDENRNIGKQLEEVIKSYKSKA